MKATMAWRCHACDDLVKDYLCVLCLSEQYYHGKRNTPDHVDDLPVVKPNQPDVVLVIPEPVLVYEDDDPKEEEFKEEEEPQEEEDMDIDDKEDENEPELIFPYEEADPLNPLLPASDSEPEDVIEKGKAKYEYYGKLILDLGNEVRSSMEEGMTAMKNLVRKLGNSEERAECKKLKKELEDTRSSNILLSLQKERIERDLYWTRVQAHEFYQEMIRMGFVFEERPNEAIDVPVEEEESTSSEPRGSPRDS
ncbi:hypothetical protein Tco_0801915 [Tanacetum coccineum]|uniref:Uncharacterized protein n=1 Tax=Tanacetum coccineum TaxID=301880 RepID=A0ABQ5A1I5_9ASTR